MKVGAAQPTACSRWTADHRGTDCRPREAVTIDDRRCRHCTACNRGDADLVSADFGSRNARTEIGGDTDRIARAPRVRPGRIATRGEHRCGATNGVLGRFGSACRSRQCGTRAILDVSAIGSMGTMGTLGAIARDIGNAERPGGTKLAHWHAIERSCFATRQRPDCAIATQRRLHGDTGVERHIGHWTGRPWTAGRKAARRWSARLGALWRRRQLRRSLAGCCFDWTGALPSLGRVLVCAVFGRRCDV